MHTPTNKNDMVIIPMNPISALEDVTWGLTNDRHRASQLPTFDERHRIVCAHNDFHECLHLVERQLILLLLPSLLLPLLGLLLLLFLLLGSLLLLLLLLLGRRMNGWRWRVRVKMFKVVEEIEKETENWEKRHTVYV